MPIRSALLVLIAALAAGPLPSAMAEEPAVRCPFKPNDAAGEVFSPESALTHTPCVAGMAGIYPCRDVDLMAFVPLSGMGCSSGNDNWGWVDPLTNREYVLMGCNNGTSFVDITSPENPIYLGRLPTHTVNSSWRDIKVYNNYAFIVSEASGHGMQVFDLTRLRGVVNPPVTFTRDAHYGGFGNAHNIAINEATGFAYPIGSGTCSGGPHVVNIQNPLSPVFAGCVNQDGYTHDTQCVIYNGPHVAFRGKEICFSSNEDTLTIVDVTNKSNPVQLSRTSYVGVQYTHQGWLTEDHRYFLLDDELDEQRNGNNTRTYIWDVSNLYSPVNFANYTGPVRAIDHNLYIKGNLAFEANYRSGLRILDITNIAAGNLVEVAFFDIYPPDDNPNFNGAWSVYPYFPSGMVSVSGIEQGLFILRPSTAPEFDLNLPSATASVCTSGSDAKTINVHSRNGYTGTVTLSAVGLPAGASASFSTNPVVVPGSSVMTIVASGVTAGTHPFTVRGSDGSMIRNAAMTLVVSSEPPAAPTLSAPADGATNIPIAVPFQWVAAPNSAAYELEVALDPSFSSLSYSATVTTTSHTSTALAAGTRYFWRVRAQNACGAGPATPARVFTTRTTPAILLVDDDNNSPNVLPYYTGSLGSLGAAYDIWDTTSHALGLVPEHGAEPDAATLANYETVLWFSGDAFGGTTDPKAGPTAVSEGALATFLVQSKCLFLSSQDYFYDRGTVVNAFMSGHLGVASIQNDRIQTSVAGNGSAFGGLGPYALAFPPGLSNYSDAITPDATASVAFIGSQGNAAISKMTASFRTLFFGFPWEAIPTAADRTAVMRQILNFCGAGLGEPTGLRVRRTATDLIFEWSVPAGACSGSGYALYSGTLDTLSLGSGYSHAASLGCGIDGTSFQTPIANPAIGSAAYFLVVAQSDTEEGSYGKSSASIERPRSPAACRPAQNLKRCY